MSKRFLKSGNVVVMLQGRHAGKKAVIVRQYDEGHGDRHYGHCIVAGIDQYPLKISKSMDKKKIDKRSKLKPFLKVVNYNHVMPTRHKLSDMHDIKDVVKADVLSGENPDEKKEAAKAVRKAFMARYQSGTNPWFFSKLRF